MPISSINQQEFQNAYRQESLELFDIPSQPWKLIASDLFEIDGQQYLHTIDR